MAPRPKPAVKSGLPTSQSGKGKGNCLGSTGGICGMAFMAAAMAI